MNTYECIAIINPSLSEKETSAAVEKVQGVITAGGGEVLKTDLWGVRKLAYELNKQTRGYYVLYLFNAPPNIIKSLEELFKVYDPIFKHMVIKLEKKQRESALKAVAEAVPTPAAKTTEAAAPVAEAPATKAPATEAPATEAPATKAPATEAPATEAPATEAPATETPSAEAPAAAAESTKPAEAEAESPAKEG